MQPQRLTLRSTDSDALRNLALPLIGPRSIHGRPRPVARAVYLTSQLNHLARPQRYTAGSCEEGFRPTSHSLLEAAATHHGPDITPVQAQWKTSIKPAEGQCKAPAQGADLTQANSSLLKQA
ncbi:hypothetical protein NDU88_006798 [Pleurodeles waltl]|uniref:Uncharacterized protein n=1 Tax=Pleurodeles waltl TaxID=8319 RepID=A0AAV7MID4_PLEWA|nr:hypothetical protein NDU88_006798 [Pleurodeles waltl]